MPSKKRKRQIEITDQITPDQAVSVLQNLWKAYPDIRARIDTEIQNTLKIIDCNEVASDVESSLDSLDEEELYERSGPSRTGYHDPGEMAGIMIEEVLAPHQDQLKRYYQMGMVQEAKEYCKGILKGLYEYERNLSGPFAEYGRDVPAEMFGWILDAWKKKDRKTAHHTEMKKYIEKECSDWAKYK